MRRAAPGRARERRDHDMKHVEALYSARHARPELPHGVEDPASHGRTRPYWIRSIDRPVR